MSLINDVVQQAAAQAAAPSRGYSVSKKLPTFSDLQNEIDSLTQQLTAAQSGVGLNAYSPFSTHQYQISDLQRRILEKQNVLDSLKNPTDNSGIPAAPEGPAILGPRIEPPKVGLNDLKIMLPTR